MTTRAPLAAPSAPRRRAFLAVALAFLALGAVEPAAAQPVPAIGSIRVDASPLRAKGVGAYADILEEVLGRALEAQFAARRAPGGATLTVMLDLFQLRGYGSGGGREGIFGFGSSDDMSLDDLGGEAVLTVDGEVIASTYLRVALPPAASGPWYLETFELRRTEGLAAAYASWLSRRL